MSLAVWAARLLPSGFKQSLYRWKPLARLIRRGLNLAVPQGFSQVEAAAGLLRGMHLSLDLQTEKDYWLGTYEPGLQAAIGDLVKPGMIAYDVGANIGYISLALARQVGEAGKVFAFEALPANLERLRLNLALNELSARVQVVGAAVVEAERPVEFWIGPSGGMGKADGSAGRREISYESSLVVEGISLDSFVYSAGNPPPQVVKLDIEGGEVLALPGMRRILAESRPLLFLELHGPEAAQAAWEVLQATNYRLCSMAEGYPRIDSRGALDWKAYVVAFPMR